MTEIEQNRRSQRFVHYMKVLALSFWIAVFSGGEVHAASQPKFDLVCDSQKGSSIRFRFDLPKREWCQGKCRSVWFIDELGDNIMKMALRSKDDSDHWTIYINRYTSQFWTAHQGHGNGPEDWGHCEVEDFSGFPQKSF